jgi:superfamily II DNA or RNA helicase
MSSWPGSAIPISIPPARLGLGPEKLDARYLTRRTEHAFDAAVRRRGADYYRSGDVTSCRGDNSGLVASVVGSSLYQVRVEVLGRGTLGVDCSCSYFDERGFCKHLWSVLLQAEQRGLLREVGGGPNAIELLELEEVEAEEYLEDDDSHERHRAEPRRPSKPPTWRDLLGDADAPQATEPPPTAAKSIEGSLELSYLLPIDGQPADGLAVQLWSRPSSHPGSGWQPAEFHRERLATLGDPVERELCMLLGLADAPAFGSIPRRSGVVVVPVSQAVDLVRRLAATGRCRLGTKSGFTRAPLQWDRDEPWQLVLELSEDASRLCPAYALRGILRRAQDKRELEDAEFLHAGLVVVDSLVAPCSTDHATPWLKALTEAGSISIPSGELESFVRQYCRVASVPELELPPAFALTQQEIEPEFVLDVLVPDLSSQGLPCRASAVYGREQVSLDARGTRVVDFEARRLYPRKFAAEQQAKVQLSRLGFRGRVLEVAAGFPCWGTDEIRLAAKRLPAAVEALTKAGWRVLAQGKSYRRMTKFSVSVTTGIDWLGLRGGVSFEGVELALPSLLRALSRKELTVVLDDGTLGLLPEDWLERWGTVAELAAERAEPEGEVRLRRAHVGLVDALLETVDSASFDEAFASLRRELKNFEELRPVEAPPSFVGKLRPYQTEGLAWLEFLARMGFGGCLADDMGLGKTIQVLALLLARYDRAPQSRARSRNPSLIVVPRSLVHNWIDEARRFAPSLRLLSHVGSDRDQDLGSLRQHHALVTSYGTLLRDLERLQQIEFDCIVLDEAQAIKTAGTQTARAVRVLRGALRIALTGTPVENHLGELWSLFDFLNPGLLGQAVALKRSVTRTADGESAGLLRRAIRPFVLRRTKAEVAKELPRRSEETLWVELDREERRRYDELLRYYRASVKQRVEVIGIERSTAHLLEALLRLRQAACHPGLIDPTRRHKSSAKLEVLLEQLSRLGEEGHKALVFSQFTSLLSIVRERLDAQHVSYEYLDGKTRDRAARVAHFQADESVRYFLISLKAGGLGLNLTAADYVFILDPWWNPAVEAQAIDRTHRIGQTRHVFAYRLIARDTVEERVAELQRTKKKLVEAILGEKSGLSGRLTRQDLECLLG